MKKTNFKRVSADDLDTTIEAGVERLRAARELSTDEISAVSGGAAASSQFAYFDKKWFGVWPDELMFNSKLKNAAVLVDVQISPELGAHMQAGMAGRGRP